MVQLELTQEQLDYIGFALSEKPYKDVAELIININKQIHSQIKNEKITKEDDNRGS